MDPKYMSSIIYLLGLTTEADAMKKYNEVKKDCQDVLKLEVIICVVLLLVKFVIIKRFI